jgi:hypothetical protein
MALVNENLFEIFIKHKMQFLFNIIKQPSKSQNKKHLKKPMNIRDFAGKKSQL